VSELPDGLYERLVDEELQELLAAQPELRPVLRSLDDEAQPHTYARFVFAILEQALRIKRAEDRPGLINRILKLLAATDGLDYLGRRRLLAESPRLLLELGRDQRSRPRPKTALATSFLLTGQRGDPALEHELRAEMATSDRVDILVSFIKWSGLRLLRPAFELLTKSNTPIRIISTSYMGASDPAALEWLARQPNIEIRLSYDTAATRMHAKAYQFLRNTGFSTAYIGSANMSHAAMTSGLEWTVKVTEQDMAHILTRFTAEFEAYWESPQFEPFTEQHFERFRSAIKRVRETHENSPAFFAEITPRPFQERILEALTAAREAGSYRNLVVAATGTGKTVISALDYQAYAGKRGGQPRLLFVANRKEILEQARDCFRAVLRDRNFGDLLVDGTVPAEWDHVFASVQSLRSRRICEGLGAEYFQFVVVDEAHHIAASSYRPLFANLRPGILLGLTATPERMDGSSILPDFDGRFAAEVRLYEALDERLLCPFHYFGVSDPIDLSEESFWRNGQYDIAALELVLTGDDFRARARLDTVIAALNKYQPDLSDVKSIGFCVSVKHAEYMADKFTQAGFAAEVLTGNTPSDARQHLLRKFRLGEISFLFTVDVLSEGVDVPEINLVMFLRPTESLTVFLQQLGRGLRHAPGKECLTVLDFVGQTHRRYRVDRKFSALLSGDRLRLDREIEQDFPSLPAGCNIQLERVARDIVLSKVKAVLSDLQNFIPEVISTWGADTEMPLTFGNFIEETGLPPVRVLRQKSWSEWKALGLKQPAPDDPDMADGRKALARLALRSDPELLDAVAGLADTNESSVLQSEKLGVAVHYLLWGRRGDQVGVTSVQESINRWQANPSLRTDAREIARWKKAGQQVPIQALRIADGVELRLHADYGSAEIKALLGLATIDAPGPTGVGVIHSQAQKLYVHLVTFNKDERDFSPTTRYEDYPISRTKLHWQSQSGVSQASPTGQNYLNFQARGYTVLFFARAFKRLDGETLPFTFIGPAKRLLSWQGDRPISMTWELEYPMPAAMFELTKPA
jgi:superfamily II DNA or RNA helicase/HKD family nuclease